MKGKREKSTADQLYHVLELFGGFTNEPFFVLNYSYSRTFCP